MLALSFREVLTRSGFLIRLSPSLRCCTLVSFFTAKVMGLFADLEFDHQLLFQFLTTNLIGQILVAAAVQIGNTILYQEEHF